MILSDKDNEKLSYKTKIVQIIPIFANLVAGQD